MILFDGVEDAVLMGPGVIDGRGDEDLPPIAAVAVANGDLSGLGVTDPLAAESHLVQALVSRATQDFWPYWVRQ